MNDFLQTILLWSSSSPYWLGSAIFITAFLECLALVGIVLPGVVLMFGLAVIAGGSSLELTTVLLLAWLGGLCGDFISYALGYRLKNKVPQLPLLRSHRHWLINAELHFQRYGVLSLLLGRFIGPLRPILPLVAGMLAMPFIRFAAVSVFAAAGWAIAYLMPGWMVGAAFELHSPPGFWLQASWVAACLALCAAFSIFGCLRGWRTSSLVSAAVSSLALFALMLSWQHLSIFDLYLHELSQLLRTSWLDHSMVLITRLGDFSTQLVVSVILCALLLLFRQFQALIFASSTLLITAVSNWLFKHFFERARPSLLLEPLQSFSFPSGHSASGFAFFLVLGVLASRQQPQRWRVLWLLIALVPAACIALSRVYLTAHWPTDILAGALLASVICSISLMLVQTTQPMPALRKQHWQLIIPLLLLTLTALLSWNFAEALQMYAH
ncbi:MAG: bifunctional DedA family/phosphatase PAP2 family protein [Pseudomonas sp.]|jgi:undecaprenyl-diphosphatase|nr:bifunctional DedA family/phosphatase PAP2 family protein [Pseudomonas sp.]MDD2223014.1 bifunctional DedA family/phosphatase PAP2 family protein [Pseudomonas sp.]MDY0414980.1 bifunctional DedA family/phosphatase PAP2 family protein [Pseudomonas sp.]NLO53202.1 phosphatase PAP2 family protein [Gammaproteobacteria bacterium]